MIMKAPIKSYPSNMSAQHANHSNTPHPSSAMVAKHRFDGVTGQHSTLLRATAWIQHQNNNKKKNNDKTNEIMMRIRGISITIIIIKNENNNTTKYPNDRLYLSLVSSGFICFRCCYVFCLGLFLVFVNLFSCICLFSAVVLLFCLCLLCFVFRCFPRCLTKEQTGLRYLVCFCVFS